MVRVVGPALSLGASGTLGKTLIFQKMGKSNAAYKYHKPGSRGPYTPSYKQRDQRAIIGLLTAHWQSMTPAQKLTWEEEAAKAGVPGSGYHHWLTKAQTNLYFYHGLAGYWSFNDGPTGTVRDLSGNGNTGTLYPSYPTNCPSFVDGQNPKFGKALNFDGINDYVDCGQKTNLDSTDEITVEAWINPKTTIDPICIYSKGSWWGPIYFYIVDNYLTWRQGNSAGNFATYLTSFATVNKYSHVVVVAKSLQFVKLYVNGTLKKSYTVNVKPIGGSSAYKASIGRETGGNRYFFSGLIDDVRAYNRALSSGEILKHYQMLRGNK